LKHSLSLAGVVAVFAVSGCQIGLRTPSVGVSPPPAGAPAAAAAPAAPAAAPAGCAEELGADASDELAVAPQVSVAPSPSRRFTGCVARDDKGDAFAILVPEGAAGTMYRVAVSALGDASIGVELYDEDKRRLTGYLPLNQGKSGELWFAAAGNSSAYVLIKPSYNHQRSGHTYSIDIAATRLVDTDEPNDEPGRATALALGAAHQALVHPLVNAADRHADAYRVELPRAGNLGIVVADVPQDIRARVEIRDAAGKRVTNQAGANAGATVRVSHKVPAGTYFVTIDANGPYYVSGVGEPPPHLVRPYRITATLD